VNTRLLVALVMTVLLGAPASSRAAQGLLVEWSDHHTDQNVMVGDPVFQRTLSCTSEGGHDDCELTVITIGRTSCPAALTVDVFSTKTGELRVSRKPKGLDLEFTRLSATWTIHLDLIGHGSPIVERASGVVVVKPLLRSDRLRSSELVALVNGHEEIHSHEFAEVILTCPKIAVVAAKREAK